jgi:hypothetical protein
MRDRRLQRALLQFFKPENYFEVCQALRAAGRADLIGDGCEALVPARPPRQALEARRQRADQEVRQGKYVHQIPAAQPETSRPAARGYRPHRQGARRRERRRPDTPE